MRSLISNLMLYLSDMGSTYYFSDLLAGAFEKLGVDLNRLLNDIVEIHQKSEALSVSVKDPQQSKTIVDVLEFVNMRKLSIREAELFHHQNKNVELQRALDEATQARARA